MAPFIAVAVVLAVAASAAAEAVPQAIVEVPAMFVFGDSTADVGNNNHLPGGFPTKADYPHNGVDFPGGVPTGRFSNGYNGIDYIAQNLGFEKSPPPFLSLNTTDAFHGVNFASGASGILDTTGPNVSLSMTKQVDNFKALVGNLTSSTRNESSEALLLSKSVFLFSTGNNDIFAFFRTFDGKDDAASPTRTEQFTSLVTETFRAQLQELHALGARKFSVMGTGDLGCIPVVRAATPTGDCVGELNDLSRRFNAEVSAMLGKLKAELAGVEYSFSDPYELVASVMADPLRYGYKEVKGACCGSGRLNAESQCVPSSTYCTDREEYFFWDAYHPTQKTYKLVAEFAINGSQLLGQVH